jgi:hypothetical protein
MLVLRLSLKVQCTVQQKLFSKKEEILGLKHTVQLHGRVRYTSISQYKYKGLNESC